MWLAQLNQLMYAKDETYKLDAVMTLLGTESRYATMFRSTQRKLNRDDYYKQRAQTFGFLNKQKDGLYKLCEIVKSRLSKVAGKCDICIINEKINAHLTLVTPENTDAMYVGDFPVAPEFKSSFDLKSSYKQITGTDFVAVVQRALNIIDNTPLDLLTTKFQIGGVHLVRVKRVFEGTNGTSFKTSDLDIRMACAEKRSLVTQPYTKLLRYSRIGRLPGGNSSVHTPTRWATEHGKFEDILMSWTKSDKPTKISATKFMKYMIEQALKNNVDNDFKRLFDDFSYAAEGGLIKFLPENFSELMIQEMASVYNPTMGVDTLFSLAREKVLAKQSNIVFGLTDFVQAKRYMKGYTKVYDEISRTYQFLKDIDTTPDKENALKFLDAVLQLIDRPVVTANKISQQGVFDKYIDQYRLMIGGSRGDQTKVDIVTVSIKRIFPPIFYDLAIHRLKIALPSPYQIDHRVFRDGIPATSDRICSWIMYSDKDLLGVETDLRSTNGELDMLMSSIGVCFNGLQISKSSGYLAELNVPLPWALLVCRPHIEGEASQVVFLQSGGGTMDRYTMDDRFTLGQHTEAQMIVGHLTCIGGCHLHSPEHLYHEEHAMINRIIRGMSTSFFEVADLPDGSTVTSNQNRNRVNYQPLSRKYGTADKDSIVVIGII
jgi:hypothetical protein